MTLVLGGEETLNKKEGERRKEKKSKGVKDESENLYVYIET